MCSMRSLGDIIESVRQKPEHVRMRYVFLCVAVCMLLLFGVWLLSVSRAFQSLGGISTSPVLEESTRALEPSLQEVTESFRGGVDAIETEGDGGEQRGVRNQGGE